MVYHLLYLFCFCNKKGMQPVQPPETPLHQLKTQIALNNLQLLELTSHHQKFIAILHSYNKSGVHNILHGHFEHALLYLEEAEKILQYSASCGKTIDRFLIIVTLQNEAAAYQKLWELEKSSDYMEAILYNMNSYLETSAPVDMNHDIRNPDSELHKQFTTFITRRLDAVVYNLQYSAVSSQIGKHDTALRSAKKALEIMTTTLTELYAYECFIKNKINKTSPFKLLRDSCRALKKLRLESSLKEVKRKVRKLRETAADSDVEEHFKNFSIGDVMQVEPIEFGGKTKEINAELEKLSFIRKAFYVSISYYAIATELRLLAASCSLSDEKMLKKENRKSKVYHLNAISIAVDHVPCVTEYLEYILKSFKNNYQIDLDEVGSADDSSNDDLIFSQAEEESGNVKDDESYRLEHQIGSTKTEIDPFYETRNNSFEKKRYSSGRETIGEHKSKKEHKLKKLHKMESSTNLRSGGHKSKTLREESKNKEEKKSRGECSKSLKATQVGKCGKLLKRVERAERAERGEKKKSNADSSETKDQTKKNEEKRKSVTKKVTEEYLTLRREKTREKERKKKGKGEESRKKLLRLKSPGLRGVKSPLNK